MFCVLDIETVLNTGLVIDVHGKPGDSLETCMGRFEKKLGENKFPPVAFHIPVVAVLLVVNDAGMYTGHRVLTNPTTIVPEFWRCITEGLDHSVFSTLVSFNGRRFDLPVMELQAAHYGLELPRWFTFGARSYEDPRSKASSSHLDLFDYLFTDMSNRSGLDTVSKLFRLPGKTENGSNVADLYKAGRVDDIAAYCACDVMNTYGALLRVLKLTGSPINPYGDGPAANSVLNAFSNHFKGNASIAEFADKFRRSCTSVADGAPF